MKVGNTAAELCRAIAVLSPKGNAALLMLAGDDYEKYADTLAALWRLAELAEKEE
jgi:hypothetical protein